MNFFNTSKVVRYSATKPLHIKVSLVISSGLLNVSQQLWYLPKNKCTYKKKKNSDISIIV